MNLPKSRRSPPSMLKILRGPGRYQSFLLGQRDRGGQHL